LPGRQRNQLIPRPATRRYAEVCAELRFESRAVTCATPSALNVIDAKPLAVDEVAAAAGRRVAK
jgi:hypothetical protein